MKMTDYYTQFQQIISKMYLCLCDKISDALKCCKVINLNLLHSEQFVPVYLAVNVQ